MSVREVGGALVAASSSSKGPLMANAFAGTVTATGPVLKIDTDTLPVAGTTTLGAFHTHWRAAPWPASATDSAFAFGSLLAKPTLAM